MREWHLTFPLGSRLVHAPTEVGHSMKPNLVILAVPRSAAAESDEQFVRSYSWVMNWSLSFGHTEWDCIVVHPSVIAAGENSPRDELVRRLVNAQDLFLVDRAPSEDASPEVLLRRWIEAHLSQQ